MNELDVERFIGRITDYWEWSLNRGGSVARQRMYVPYTVVIFCAIPGEEGMVPRVKSHGGNFMLWT
jgi:hypothetical protein